METQNNFSREEQFILAQKKVKRIKGFYMHLAVYVIINIFLSVTAGLQYGYKGFTNSLLTTGLFWGIGLAFHWFSAVGRDWFFGKEWENRKIKEYMDEQL